MNPARLAFFVLLSSVFILGLWLPAQAAPAAQIQYATPTPGADGRILYIIQAGDTCIRIALLNGITEQQLRQFNSGLINDACTNLVEGQALLIGVGGPAGATPAAAVSSTPATPQPTATPFTGTTEICVLLFDDENGDALRQEIEPAIAGGAVSVSENNGEYSAAQDTVINPDPEAYQGVCFTDVPEGTYTVSVAIPDGYNPTMLLSYELDVNPGDLAFVDFGAQSRETTVGDSGGGTSSARSPVLGIVGAVLLIGGGALGYYAYRSARPESKLAGRSGFLRK